MKKILIPLLVLLINLQQSIYAWIATLKVMKHPNGHIVRLAGDIHLQGFTHKPSLEKAIAQEKLFLKAIEKSLARFFNMSLKKYECFVVEKIISDLSLINYNIYKEALSAGSVITIPLITRINVLGNPKINRLVKSIIAHIYKYKLQPNIKIIPYDIRSKYPKLCLMSFSNTQQTYDLFCQALATYKKDFKNDIQKQIDDNSKYKPEFRDFIIEKGNILIKIVKNELDLGHFFSSVFADFGYLVFIARNAHKNITLYLGADHCYNLAQDLKEIGYCTIFEKGLYDENDLLKNIIPGPRSKKEYKTFFEIK